MSLEPELKQVCEDVYAYLQPDGSWYLNNTGFLVSRTGVISVDATSTERRTRASGLATAGCLSRSPSPDITGQNGSSYLIYRVSSLGKAIDFGRGKAGERRQARSGTPDRCARGNDWLSLKSTAGRPRSLSRFALYRGRRDVAVSRSLGFVWPKRHPLRLPRSHPQVQLIGQRK